MSGCSHPKWGTGAVSLQTGMQYREYDDFPSPYSDGDIRAEYCLKCGVIRIPADALRALQTLRGFSLSAAPTDEDPEREVPERIERLMHRSDRMDRVEAKYAAGEPPIVAPTDEAFSKCPVCCSEAYDVPISSLGPDVWIYCAEHTPLPVEEGEELEGRVEAAFREGYRYGFDAGELGASYYGNRSTMDADEAWDESDARDARQGEGDGGWWRCPNCEMWTHPSWKRECPCGYRHEDADLLVEAAGYLESFIREQYHADHPDGIHPAQQRKYDRDMELVEGLREVADRLRSTPQGEDGDGGA